MKVATTIANKAAEEVVKETSEGKDNASEIMSDAAAKMENVWANEDDYSSLGNCRRPTLIQNGAQKVPATLKNCTTLISSAPCRDVCDAYLRRCLFSVFSILLIFSSARAAQKMFWCRSRLYAEKCAML